MVAATSWLVVSRQAVCNAASVRAGSVERELQFLQLLPGQVTGALSDDE